MNNPFASAHPTPPPGYAPPEGDLSPDLDSPKKRRRWPWIAGICAAFVVGVAGGSATADSDSTDEPQAEEPEVKEIEVEPEDIEETRAELEALQEELEARSSELDEREDELVNLDETLSAREADVTESESALEEESEEELVADTGQQRTDSGDETSEQSNAVRAAEQYLSFMGFSREGLIGQLEFEGYSTEDSTYAVDSIGVDWNEQAVLVAESYLDTMSFSRQGLVDQLIFEGFSPDQAEHGVSQAY